MKRNMERRRREGGQSRDRLEDVRKRGTGEGLGARAKDMQKGGKDGHLACVGPARHTHGHNGTYTRAFIICSWGQVRGSSTWHFRFVLQVGRVEDALEFTGPSSAVETWRELAFRLIC